MSDGARVTIRELAAARGRKPEQLEAEAAELGLLVKPDRAGRRSLSVADARGLTTGEVRRLLEHNRAWEQHHRDTNDGSKDGTGVSPKPPGRCRRGQAPEGRGASPRRPGMPPSKPDGRTRSISELVDLVESRGRDAAIRIAVGGVEQRNRGRHLVEARRRLVEYYESTP